MSWPVIALEDLCHTVTKGTTPTSIGYNFASEGIPFLRIQNLKGNSVDLEDVLYIDSSTHQALKRSMIKAGDLLITIAGTIGRTAIVPSHFPDCNCNQAVAIIRFDTEKLLPLYLLYWLNSVDAKSQIAGKKVTATISNLSLGQIKNLKIPLPPLKKQKQIAAALEKADQLRKDCQQMEQELNSLAQSVFMSSYNRARKTEASFGELAIKEKNSFVNGPFGSNLLSSELTDKGVPVLYIRDIASGEFKRKKEVYVTEEKAGELASCRVDGGDVLIAKVGDPPGTAAIYPFDQPKGIVTQDVIRLKCDSSRVLPEYLVAYFNSQLGRHALKAITVEATRSRIGLGNLKKLKVAFPAVKEQLDFTRSRKQLTHLLAENRVLMKKYNDNFDSLMQKAFKGELNL